MEALGQIIDKQKNIVITKKILIVVKPSGLGVLADVRIIKSKIPSEYIVDILTIPIKRHPDYFCYGKLKNLLPALYRLHVFFKSLFRNPNKSKYDLAIYVETVRPEYMFLGKKNVCIPNQEWFSISLKSLIPYFDEVWCKTHYAESIFTFLKGKCRYIGFSSSVDTSLRSVEKNRSYFLHRAGNSVIRGTKSLIDVWSRHPEWPMLKIIMKQEYRYKLFSAKNIEYIDASKSDSEFQMLLAESMFHIHPTQTEGYGLAISEGLAYGCIILVTDAPPMNELITSERGGLIPVYKRGIQCLSELFYISQSGLEAVIEHFIKCSDEELNAMSEAAINWFDKNEEMFSSNLKDALRSLLTYD